MSKPSKLHAAAKHLRHLKGNMSLALTYLTGCFQLTGLCDVSWGKNIDDGNSISGYLLIMAGGLLSFTTALQSVTALSTMGAELIAMALARKKVVCLSNMMAELGFRMLFDSVPYFVYHTGALYIAGNNITYSSRAKQIAL